MLQVFEAFAGIGSQHMAFKNTNIDYKITGISEIDSFALTAYKEIHGDIDNYGDISKIDVNSLPDMDLFTYSFPCTDISASGLQLGMEKGGETRSGLLWECEKIIEFKRPKVLFLENVKNLTSTKNIVHFERWLETLEDLGYTNYWKILNSKDFGVAQSRERVYAISILGEHKAFNWDNFKEYKQTTLEDILLTDAETFQKFKLSDLRLNRYVETRSNNTSNIKTWGTTKLPTAKVGQRDRCYHKTGIIGTLMASDYKEPKIVIMSDSTAKEDVVLRKLSPLEYWRLQGFSDSDFYKVKNVGISNSQLYKQAGNSITLPVLEELFKEIIRCI